MLNLRWTQSPDVDASVSSTTIQTQSLHLPDLTQTQILGFQTLFLSLTLHLKARTMSLLTDSNSTEICLTGITFLEPPGDSSNFLDWEFEVEIALEAVNLSYVLSPSDTKDSPSMWVSDNTKACAIISRAGEDGHLK